MTNRALLVTLGLAAIGAALGATPLAAQSLYGCTGIETRSSYASVEGDGGVFYRIDPDLRMHHPFADETADQLAELSQALASLGTTLIYVPVPTKALAMPDQLTQRTRDYGFDAALATTTFEQGLQKLQVRSVVTADIRRALRAPMTEPPSFFQADYRLTTDGTRRAARAIADAMALTPVYIDLPKGRFDTRPAGFVTLPSDMRTALQRHCLSELPLVETETFGSTQLQAITGGSDTIFGTGSGNGSVALLGTEVTGETAVNLAGFLAEFSGLNVFQYSVTGGGAYAAISAYLTSQQFQDTRPAFLVWTNPVENNLAQFGDQPMRELIAAAGANCRVPLRLLTAGDQTRVTADLTVLDPSQAYTLFVDADGAEATEARFDFLGGSGLIRSKSVFRHNDQVKTGRFFMPLTGLWSEGAQTVEIALDVPFGAGPRVTACFD